MAKNIHINFTKFDSLIQIADFFYSEEICKKAIAQERWGDGAAVCPYCGCTHTYMTKEGRYICKDCHKHFSVLVGTIFENTKVSLRKWFLAMYIVSCTKKGMSSCQLAREIKVTQKTAWFMLHKIRGLFGITDEIELDGEVEMDEMYLGGRETNKHNDKRTEGTQGRSTKTKTPIFGMLQRDGKVVAMKVENTKGKTLMPIVEQFVKKGATTYTDEASIYNNLSKKGYDHLFVNHSKREFVRCGDIHTNGIEGFWAHFKRVIFSTYHCVSKDYVSRYIDEQQYRWNTREEKDSYRFHDMFKKAVKHFDYNDVLSLSTVVDTEYKTFKRDVYYHWYAHNKVA
jgi:transposase-like protein